MNHLKARFHPLLAGALLLLATATAARADDTEIFFGNTTVTTPANIMFVMDTSGSMAGHVSGPAAFDPTQTYTGTCSNSYYYFATSGGGPAAVDCSNTATRIARSSFQCTAAGTALGNSSTATGYYTDMRGGLIRWGNYTTTTTTTSTTVYTSSSWPGGWGTFNSTQCGRHGGTWLTGPNRCSVTTTTTTTNATHAWQNNLQVSGGTDVECAADRPGVGTDSNYPDMHSDVSSTGGRYSSNSADSWWAVVGNTGGNYTVFSANYLNYYAWAPSSIQTRMSSVQNAATGLLGLLSGVNVGLMTYSYGGSGGMVRTPVQSIDATGVRSTLVDEINHFVPAGDTPLSETLFEAYRYFSGGNVLFGGDGTNGTFQSTRCTAASSFLDRSGAYIGSCDSSENFPSVASSQSPAGTYNSPADYSCQKNYIVYLTDGEPTNDNEADSYMKGSTTSTRITATSQADCEAQGGVWRTSRRGRNTCTVTTTTGGLPNFQSVTGGCVGTASGRCTSALAKYMYQSDLRGDVTGTQNVKSYFIGFGSDFFDANTGTSSASFQFLQDAATAGGGLAFTATDYSSLTSVFNTIIADIAQDVDTSFSAPSVAVNAFNRTQTLDDLYVSVFSPQTTMHWPGNLKKYKVVNTAVKDADGADAVNPSTGFFKTGSRSYWSATADGPDVVLGGAAHMLPDPARRNVLTYIGTNAPGSGQNLTSISTAITSANATSVLNLQSGDPTYSDLISWAKGTDVKHENPPEDTSGVRHAMGDPVHSEPAVVIYGGASGTHGYDTVVYLTTNDGYLHAINATANTDGSDASDSGQELWSFIPQEMLPELRLLYADAAAPTKHYSLDGPVRVLKYDVNGDGTVDSAHGDRVILYFTTGRSTAQSRYYAVDVTDKAHPQFLWSLSPTELPGLGQTWSSPTVARVTVGGASQNGQHLVLIFGGGYDAVEDGYSYASSDTVGNHLYMVDAKTGTVLWTAGPTNANNFTHTRMTHAIPSAVTVLDVNNDGFADRMYVGDMAGQLWRFDIKNGNTAANLVTGGVIASLGTKEDTTHTMANTRRFYAAPDVALIEPVGQRAFMSIAIGSGYRGHPVNTEVADRMYSIRDYNPFTPLTQTVYNGLHLILDSEVTDITSNLEPTMSDGSYGWKLRLTAASGEKIVTSARTLANTVYFTSYSPGSTTTVSGDPCSTQRTSGNNRVYAVSVFNGAPVKDRNDDGSLTTSDRSADLRQGGIAPGISLLFPAESTDGAKRDVVVMSGPEHVDDCPNCRALLKTYWYDGSID
ncbi:MAG: PilC/PilY family type IV pilus protein [Steroidobacteraceae bacterium]